MLIMFYHSTIHYCFHAWNLFSMPSKYSLSNIEYLVTRCCVQMSTVLCVSMVGCGVLVIYMCYYRFLFFIILFSRLCMYNN